MLQLEQIIEVTGHKYDQIEAEPQYVPAHYLMQPFVRAHVVIHEDAMIKLNDVHC